MKGVFVFLAEGFEETEAIATWDVLRRGGIDATMVSISEIRMVTGSHGLPVEAAMTRSEFEKAVKLDGTTSEDAMVFPGGMPGTRNLAADEALMSLMIRHYEDGGTVAAICAAPGYVVSQLPSLEGKVFTCFDGCEAATVAKGAEYVKVPAVTDGNLITGRGPGCAVEFGLQIVAHIKGEEVAAKVRSGLML